MGRDHLRHDTFGRVQFTLSLCLSFLLRQSAVRFSVFVVCRCACRGLLTSGVSPRIKFPATLHLELSSYNDEFIGFPFKTIVLSVRIVVLLLVFKKIAFRAMLDYNLKVRRP